MEVLDAPPTRAAVALRWGAAVGVGVAWGLARPTLGGAVPALLGFALLPHLLDPAAGWRARLGDAARSVLLGLVWGGLGAAWVGPALATFGLDGARAAHAALVVLQAATLAVPGALSGALAARGLSPGLATALGWAATLEAVLLAWPLPHGPWLLAVGWPRALDLVAIGGVTGATFAWIATATLRPRGAALAGLALLALPPGAPPPGDAGPRVGVVQPDVDPFDARRSSTADARTAQLVALAHRLAAAGADLVVTPEGSWPRGPETRAGARDAARLPDLPVVLGTQGPPDGTNRLVAWDGGVVGAFARRHRLPLTEVAVAGWGRDQAAAADTPRTLALGGLALAPFLCGESLHPSAWREALPHDPDLLVHAVNDGWTGDGPGTAWHLAASRVLAAATGRPVIRAGLSGPSAVVDARGRLRASAPAVAFPRPRGAPADHAFVAAVPLDGGPPGAAVSWWLALLSLVACGVRLTRPPRSARDGGSAAPRGAVSRRR